MRVAFLAPGLRNAYKLCPFMELNNVFCPCVPHTRAQPSEQLEYYLCQRTFVWRKGFYAFCHVFFRTFLAVPVGGFAFLHGGKRAHAPVNFVFFSLYGNYFSWRFISARKQRTQHYRVCSGGKGLGNISRKANAPICYNRHIFCFGYFCHVHNGGELGHSYAAYDSCGANGTGAYAYFQSICERHHFLCGFWCGNISHDEVCLYCFFDFLCVCHYVWFVCMSAINRDEGGSRLV